MELTEEFRANIIETAKVLRAHERRLFMARTTQSLGQQPGAKAHASRKLLKENEWLAIDLAAKLEMPKNTLFSWIRRGWVHVVRQLPGYRGRAICWADADELDRLGRLRQTKHGWWDPPLPAELTTPKVCPSPAKEA